MGLFDLFSNDTADRAAQQRKAGLQQGYEALSSTYGQGRDAINAGAATATGYYQPLIAKYGGGSNAYGDASGANGVEGMRRGTEAFKNSGQYGVYGINLGEGLQALQRTHAAAGNLNSGNADADTLKYATDQATKAYGSYLSGLQPYLGQEGNAVAGAANVATGQGTALNQSFQGQGNAANANYTGQGAADAAATMNNYNVGANQFNALLAGGKLAAGLFGGFGGGGGNILPGGPNGPAAFS